MVPVLVALGVFLVGWGVYVLVTGDFVATLDIAAGLVGTGIAVIALAAVVRSLEHIAQGLVSRPLAAPPRAEPEPKSQPQPQLQSQPRRAAQPSYPPEPPQPAAPAVVREGDIEGHRYRFYSDGSIEAEGPRGLRRYRSIDEAREQILRDRNGAEESDPRSTRKPPEAPRPPRPAGGTTPAIEPADQPYPSRYAVRSPAPAPESEPYVPRYNPPGTQSSSPPPAAEDDEWSEPFRMLLKGDPGGAKPDKR